jgi:hypothetical protein
MRDVTTQNESKFGSKSNWSAAQQPNMHKMTAAAPSKSVLHQIQHRSKAIAKRPRTPADKHGRSKIRSRMAQAAKEQLAAKPLCSTRTNTQAATSTLSSTSTSHASQFSSASQQTLPSNFAQKKTSYGFRILPRALNTLIENESFTALERH